jgi:hypothetical protein
MLKRAGGRMSGRNDSMTDWGGSAQSLGDTLKGSPLRDRLPAPRRASSSRLFVAIVVIWTASGGCSGSDPCSNRGCSGAKDCVWGGDAVCDNLFACWGVGEAETMGNCQVSVSSACFDDSHFNSLDCPEEISPCIGASVASSMAKCIADAGLTPACAEALVQQAAIAFRDGG